MWKRAHEGEVPREGHQAGLGPEDSPICSSPCLTLRWSPRPLPTVHNAVTSVPSSPPTRALVHSALTAWPCYSSNPRNVPTPGPLRWPSPSCWNALLCLLPSTRLCARMSAAVLPLSTSLSLLYVLVTLTMYSVCACSSSVLPRPLERQLHEGRACHPSCSPLYPDACNTVRPSWHLRHLVNEQINLYPPHYSPAHMPQTLLMQSWETGREPWDLEVEGEPVTPESK